MSVTIVFNNKNHKLIVAKKPLMMEYLYRVQRYAWNESLFWYARENPGMIFSIKKERFKLYGMTPEQDLMVQRENSPQEPLYFSDFLKDYLGYQPVLLTSSQAFDLYLHQTA